MASTAFMIINSGFGNVGQPAPNAVLYADVLVKDNHDQVIYSQPSGVSATLTYGDTQATILAKLAASVRATLNDPSLQVVFL